jgi:hypothetical protein
MRRLRGKIKMTLLNLRNLARMVIPSLKTDVVPSATSSTQVGLDLILNEAVKDIASFTGCLSTNKKFNAVASQGDVSNPYVISTVIGNFLTMAGGGLCWNQGTSTVPQWKTLNPRTIEWMNDNRSNWREIDDGTPEDYIVDGNNLIIVPAPVSSLSEGLWLFYGKAPATMSSDGSYPFSGSTVELTHLSPFDMAIIYYARMIISPAFNLQTNENLSLAQYNKERLEKWNLMRSRSDLAQVVEWKGPLIRA